MSTPPVPQHCPSPRELDDLELLAGGGLAPITRFNEPGSPVTLTLPEGADVVELVDPEGLPLARVTAATGEVEPLTHAQYGPFRRLHLTPAQVREAYAGRTFVPVADALSEAELAHLSTAGPLALLALVGTGTPALSPVALLRATLAAAAHLRDAVVVAVPLASHGDAQVDHDLGRQVVATYAGPDPILALPDSPLGGRVASAAPLGGRVASASERIETPPEVEVRGAPATPVVEVRGAPATSLETPAPKAAPESPGLEAQAPGRLHTSTTDGYPADIAAIIDEDQPAPEDQGLVLFFTGLSGSGKSTLAQALMDRLLEKGGRTVTSLDGDVVRRNLSAGLTFSKADRETNIRRIGWVAAEISRHGGVAVCSPIAPFDETRQQVRAMVDAAGGAFFLVHVATPLEECERRDRKGLYAKARRGEIPEFTGISSPYEEPQDADVRVDTTGRTIDDALDDVIAALRDAGYLDLTTAPLAGRVASASERIETPPVVEVRGAPATSLETPAPEAVPESPGLEAQAPERLRTSTTGEPLKVLFVCTANICRSPFMELVAREVAGPDAGVEFTSAGTHGFRSHPMDEVMAGTLAPRGIDGPGDFRSRALTGDMVDEADLVLTAEAVHRTFILDDRPGSFRKVFTLGQFVEAAATVGPDLHGRALLEAVGGRRGTADPALDVDDPYSKGPEAAEAGAKVIEERVRAAVTALLG